VSDWHFKKLRGMYCLRFFVFFLVLSLCFCDDDGGGGGDRVRILRLSTVMIISGHVCNTIPFTNAQPFLGLLGKSMMYSIREMCPPGFRKVSMGTKAKSSLSNKARLKRPVSKSEKKRKKIVQWQTKNEEEYTNVSKSELLVY
jgi:hypothetical protein